MATHRAQRYRPKNVGKILLPAGHPFALHAYTGSGQDGLVPFQQHQIGPPGIVPAGRFENLVQLGGMNEALDRKVDTGEEAGLLGVMPVGRLGEAVEHVIESGVGSYELAMYRHQRTPDF